MDYNKLITPVQLIILNDKGNDGKLEDLLPDGEIRAGKGPRKPKGWVGINCFTIHISSNPRDPNTKAHNGTMRVNHYCPNYPDGNANVELMGPVSARLVELLDDWRPEIDSYEILNWVVEEPLGPLFDSNEPKEHYSSIAVSFFVRKL